MNYYNTQFNILRSLVSLAGLWYLLFWLYRDYRVDLFRQQLFSLRDQLFDLAVEKEIPFSHPAYGLLRSTINGLIRFGHRLSLAQITLSLAFGGHDGSFESENNLRNHWTKTKSELAPIIQHEMDAIYDRMHLLVLKHLVFSSPILLLSVVTIIIPIVAWALVHFFMKTILAKLSKPLDRIDSFAMAFGK